MSKQKLLADVEHALCCPEGPCRALLAGEPKSCSAEKTEQHAIAAINLIQAEHQKWLDALTEIRKIASFKADDAEDFRRIARLASEALS